MNRAEKKLKQRAEKAARKKYEMEHHGGRSRYARKKQWLAQHSRDEVRPVTNSDGKTEMVEVSRKFWGFEIPNPKPWR